MTRNLAIRCVILVYSLNNSRFIYSVCQFAFRNTSQASRALQLSLCGHLVRCKRNTDMREALPSERSVIGLHPCEMSDNIGTYFCTDSLATIDGSSRENDTSVGSVDTDLCGEISACPGHSKKLTNFEIRIKSRKITAG